MRAKRHSIIAWTLFGLTAVSVITAVIFDISRRPEGDHLHGRRL